MDKRVIEEGLQRKGFMKVESDHHYFIYYTIAGKKTPVKTYTSHGKGKYKTLGAPLITKMAQQCRLTKPMFEDLINCPLDRDRYEQMLTQSQSI